MTWVRIDDEFYLHPKVAEAGPLALAWHVAGLCYCARYLTDGKVPRSVAPTLLNPQGLDVVDRDSELSGTSHSATWRDAVDRLVAVGLWEKTSEGYQIHDYLEYNPSREEVLAQRSKRQAAGQAGGKARAKHAAKQMLEQSTSKKEAKLNPGPGPGPLEAADAASARERAQAAAPDLPISSREVAHAWHAALNAPGGCPGLVHAEHSWRPDYETVAAALNVLEPPNNRIALVALLGWFWSAPDGPIRSGRIKRRHANPGHLAKRISTDLIAANEWYRAQPEQEAAQ